MGDSPVTVPTAPTVENTAAVVVSYNPGPDFAAHLAALLEQFPMLYWVDNGGGAAAANEISDSRLLRLVNTDNAGLGAALNQGCQMALEAGWEWVVTLDQDSELLPGFLQRMVAAWSLAVQRPVLLGCNYYSTSRNSHRVAPQADSAPSEVRTVITSGTLTNLPCWHSLGRFREDFFIDAIDHEICLRARGAGCTVALYAGVLMEHSIGEAITSGAWLGRFRPYPHTPMRDYTNARNTVRVLLDYGLREPLWCLRRTLGLISEMLATLVFEPDRGLRLGQLALGVADGLRNRMGPPRVNRHDQA